MPDYKKLIPAPLKSLLWRGAWKLMEIDQRRDLAASYSMTSMEMGLARLAVRGFQPSFCLDVGAYHGLWSKTALRIFGSTRVVMVEAQPGKAVRLQEICRHHPERAVCEFALLGSAQKTAVPFYEMETGSSVYEEKSSFKRELKHYDMTTLDELIKPHITRLGVSPQLLKLDVQGSELDILRGALQALNKAEVVILEMSLIPINRGAPDFTEVYSFMDAQGFSLTDIASLIRRPMDDALIQMDAIFARKTSALFEEGGFTRGAT